MSSTVALAARQTFRSLEVRNFRLWFFGQSVSMIGYFVQVVGQALLVLELTGSGSMLGLVTALQFLPILVVGPWAGVLCDRVDKRRFLLVTQTITMALAFALGVLVLSDTVTITWVIFLAATTGLVWAFEQPSRRTIVTELVNDDDAANAVSLNGAVANLAKVVGPGVGGVVIALVGFGWCFVVNGASTLVVLAALWKMDPHEIHRPVPVKRARGQIRDGFRYVWADSSVRFPLVMLGVVAVLSFNWNVLLPLLATRDFGGSAGTYALLFGAMSMGSLLGTLWLARRTAVRNRFLAIACMSFGLALATLAVAPTVVAAAVAGAAVGATAMVMFNGTITGIQLGAAPEMRGRVMAVFSMVMFGSMAIGGPLAGVVAEQFGARSGLGLGAVAALAAGFALLVAIRPRSTATDAELPEPSFGLQAR